MAHTEKLIHAPAEAVFDVLSDPRAYQRFVVGSKAVRRFDARWPEADTAIHHTVGVGPLFLRDKTVVTRCEPPDRLVLRPCVRPFLVTETVFFLQARGDDTLLLLDEHAVGGLLCPAYPGPLDALMGLRNQVVARRLAQLAEQRHATRRAGLSSAAMSDATPSLP
jgi:hypothetical protein